MKQSRLMSMLETALSTAAGFGLSLFLQWLILPLLLGVEIPLHSNLAFAAIMTVASLLRGFVLRRVFEALHIRRPLSAFMQAVIAERFRQIEQEGWDLLHDDALEHGDLARAGAAYLKQADLHFTEGLNFPLQAKLFEPAFWPWSAHFWKPTGFRRDLVKGCALGIAEGEKFDRNRKTGRVR